MTRRWDVGPQGRIMGEHDGFSKGSFKPDAASAPIAPSNGEPGVAIRTGDLLTPGDPSAATRGRVEGAGDCDRARFSHMFTFRDTVMRVNGLCFSPDGSLLLQSSWDCSLQILDVHRCCCVRSLHSNKHGIESVQLVAHSSHLCVCPTKQQNASVQKPPPSGQVFSEATPAVTGVARGPPANGALSKTSEAGVIAAPSHTGVATPSGGCAAPSFENGCSYTLRLWDLRENRYIRVFPVTGRVIAGTGVCPHPTKAAFVCCTDDGAVSYFVAERETSLWRKQVNSHRPLVAIDPEGTTLAVYEGSGSLRMYDINNPEEAFLTFNVAKYLQGHCDRSSLAVSEALETPTSLIFSPEGGQLILGTDRERLFSFSSFTGELATVWQPPDHTRKGNEFRREWTDWQRELESALNTQGAVNPVIDLGVPEEHSFPSYVGSWRKKCAGHEGFIPSVECFSETLFYGCSDGNVYGYDMVEAAAFSCKKPLDCASSDEAEICHQCGGESLRWENVYAKEAGGNFLSETSCACCCRRSQPPVHTLGPHVCEPLWTATNPKYPLVATASINCSLWKGTTP